MASLKTISPRHLSQPFKPFKTPTSYKLTRRPSLSTTRCRRSLIRADAAKELDELPVQTHDRVDHPDLGFPMSMSERREGSEEELVGGPLVGGFEDRLSFEGLAGGNLNPEVSGGGRDDLQENDKEEDMEKLINRVINASIVLVAGSFAVTKLLTIDHDYWHGWTLYEILRYAPQHNWTAYEEILKTNPVFAKMVISGVVYSLGDWIAQCYEGKPLFEFDRARMFRSGITGFCLHGSLSHFYYGFCEALFPFQDWWAVPLKVAFDQTVWSAVWNSIYYIVLGLLRFESPVNIYNELKTTFGPMLTAGWKLWPFAHLVTYGVIPVEQRLLWVDCVELIWVTILSTYSNEKSEARISEALVESTGSENPSEE